MSDQAGKLWFPSALVGQAWCECVLLSIDAAGRIEAIVTDRPRPGAEVVDVQVIDGVAIPGMVNVHSHAFQRSIAGLTEYRTSESDSFWTWRKLMYESVQGLTPESTYAIAANLYRELLQQGYTAVGEFHYIHNDPNGQPYNDRSILSEALIQAARDTGIGICLLPVLYQRGGFRDELLDFPQHRFEMDQDSYLNLLAELSRKWADEPGVEIGAAFHSLRAVSIAVMQEVVAAYRKMAPNGVVHIHIAEQLREVSNCLEVTGRRPVEYLFSEMDVDQRWCLIHATHINDAELTDIVKHGVIVGLCPTTEANLGDGIFPAEQFLDAGGRIAIGSDSHISVSPRSELRLLEYGQRLTKHSRAVLGTDTKSVGQHLFDAACAGGRAAIGLPETALQVGQFADLAVIDTNHPTIAGAQGQRLMDRYVFSDTGLPVIRTMCRGRWV